MKKSKKTVKSLEKELDALLVQFKTIRKKMAKAKRLLKKRRLITRPGKI